MNHLLTRRQFHLMALASAACALGVARADDYPSRSLRLVLPVGTGGGGDTLNRFLAEQLAAQIAQPVVVENRPGADGLIAMRALLSAPADGYTLLLIGPQPMVFNPLLREDLPYRPADLRPVIGVSRSWTVLVTSPGSRFANFQDVVTALRDKREAVTIGTSGLSYRVGATLLGHRIGAPLEQVPYKSFPQILNDLAGGVLDLGLVDTTPVVPLAAGGKLRVLAAAAPERLPQLPEVPTIRENGVEFDFDLWTALAVRAETPEPIVRRLEAELRTTLTGNALREFVARLGTTQLTATTGGEIAAEIAAATERFRHAVAEAAPDIGVAGR